MAEEGEGNSGWDFDVAIVVDDVVAAVVVVVVADVDEDVGAVRRSVGEVSCQTREDSATVIKAWEPVSEPGGG